MFVYSSIRMDTLTHYQKYKKTIIDNLVKWKRNQPDSYKEYCRPIVRKSVAKHYTNNRDKILAYKKHCYSMKKEIALIMNLYAIYE